MALDPKHKAAFASKKAHADDGDGDEEPEEKKSKGADEEDEEGEDKDGEGDEEEGDGKPTDADLVKHVAGGIEKGISHPDVDQMMKDYDPSQGQPVWATDGEKWAKAVGAVDPGGEGADDYENPWLVTAGVYHMMGGKISMPAEPAAGGDEGEGMEKQPMPPAQPPHHAGGMPPGGAPQG
jgi:hypothetical protein